MQTVYIAKNPLDLSQWTRFEVEDIRALLVEEFPVWPSTAHIYHDVVARDHDVTPSDEASTDRLGLLQGVFWVVVYPAWANVGAAILIYAIAWVATTLLANETAKPREHTFPNGSPNNSLSERSNTARLNERIPDIYGTVRCVPDLLMYPYIVYESHRPIEYSWMCLGRGKLAPADVRDGDTLVSQIQEASAVFFPPGQSPNGGTPNLIIGNTITDNVYNVYPVKAINHQQLPPINQFYCYGSGINTQGLRNTGAKWVQMLFRYPSTGVGEIIVPTNGDPEAVKSRLRVGDELQIIWGIIAGGAPAPDLSAGFSFGNDPTVSAIGVPLVRGDLEPVVITAVDDVLLGGGGTDQFRVKLTVAVPVSLRTQWDKINTFTISLQIFNINCVIAAQNRWPVGYAAGANINTSGIFIDDPDCQEIWMNFVAQNGAYIDDSANRSALIVHMSWRVIPCDSIGSPTGDPVETGTDVVIGSMISNETRAKTSKHIRTTVGRCLLLVARTSFRIRQVDMDPNTSAFFRRQTFDLNDLASPVIVEIDAVFTPLNSTPYSGNITDDIEFTECYSMSTPTSLNVADVTTVHTRTVSNQSAARVQERQLNCKASRSVNTWNGSTFAPPEDTQDLGENMLFSILTDSKIGRRNNAEIDFASIAATFAAVRTYFGDNVSTQFSYTFDDHNMSVEETVSILCQACFVIPYRLGRVVKCDPEIATDNSSLLFNHRNKIPNSEQRTIAFGMVGDNDGVEQTFIDLDTGHNTFTPLSLTNAQPTVVSPLQSRIVGLKFKSQAAWHALRQQAKMQWQFTSVEFDALAEAATVALRQRILVEDNTRPDVQDGEVIDVSGLTLRTSQPVVFVGGSTYTVFLQHPDNTVESIPCTATADTRSLLLGFAPSTAVITNADLGVPTTYILNRDQGVDTKAFLVTDKQAQDRATYKMTAMNYSHMYYHGDALILWIPISTEVTNEEFFDRSPYALTYTTSILNLTSDVTRGPVYLGHPGDPGLFVNSVTSTSLNRYTKACWVKKNSSNAAPILTTVGSPRTEFFEVTAAGVLQAGHNNVVGVSFAGFTNSVWHHVAVTYDLTTTTMRLYLDGELVNTNTSVASRTLAGITAFGDSHGALEGFADQLRHYQRVLSPTMIRELYQKELLV